ncbi:hypothetical protein [Massilia antarctica]|uniref:hypothetical protein n=1 Tax=Massilia antarctica TaxID=2765360 RepID=UPI0006BB7059|nr:hypothetical protein [Massilia sp. H27-R4]MCY0911051.1 hypothetical protein [Massilia sp. H27-R4]CUI05373.1 hypothetical protein BN2497_5523 [Janthinobacterium sp. CG23_2]CUU29159.1 hypothetical protein BN3177_5523 [Janthinobacterium sp. CG23_2]
MTALKKTPPGQNSAYKLAAAARRAKIASMAGTIVGEVKPSQGRIRVTLGGKPISRERRAAVFGPSSIEIPEFSGVRKRKSA